MCLDREKNASPHRRASSRPEELAATLEHAVEMLKRMHGPLSGGLFLLPSLAGLTRDRFFDYTMANERQTRGHLSGIRYWLYMM